MKKSNERFLLKKYVIEAVVMVILVLTIVVASHAQNPTYQGVVMPIPEESSTLVE